MKRKRWRNSVWVLAIALTMAALSPVGQAVAAPSAKAQGTTAQFEGRIIDLSTDWGGAQACLISSQEGNQCFRTSQAMEAREKQLGLGHDRQPSGGAVTAAYAYSCSSPLRLYDYSYYGGRQLSFWDRGFWQNLWDYGFDNQVSSYIVGACYVWLAGGPYGSGNFYGGPTYPWAGEPWIPYDWDNVISSLYVG